MGVVADAALAAGGEVVGIIPSALDEREVAHQSLSELHIVETMHERKALMAERSDAFLALPGGFGTLEEFFEAVTWLQLGYHRKPSGLLDVEGYFAPLLAWMERAVRDGFVRASDRERVLSGTDVDVLLDGLLPG
jgi:uncharacterized protein (TIGR00730 family)